MSSTKSDVTRRAESDLLLWVAGGGVATVGVAWLLISQPWSSGDERTVTASHDPPVSSAVLAGTDGQAEAVPDQATGVETTLDNPLRMAQLAFDAGMLVEPEEYSAWTLYAKVVKGEPDNAAALEGLTKVAEELVSRAETAFEQGRFDDARSTTSAYAPPCPIMRAQKLSRRRFLPDVGPARASAAEAFRTRDSGAASHSRRGSGYRRGAGSPRRPVVDPIVEAKQAIRRGDECEPLVDARRAERQTLRRRCSRTRILITSLRRRRVRVSPPSFCRAQVNRSRGSTLTRPARGSTEAEALLGGSANVRNAREAWTDQLIAMEAAKPVPASALKVVNYVAPVYPERALERRSSKVGWTSNSSWHRTAPSRNIVIAEASHENFFRREAVGAVQQWRFEPRMFMGRADRAALLYPDTLRRVDRGAALRRRGRYAAPHSQLT